MKKNTEGDYRDPNLGLLNCRAGDTKHRSKLNLVWISTSYHVHFTYLCAKLLPDWWRKVIMEPYIFQIWSNFLFMAAQQIGATGCVVQLTFCTEENTRFTIAWRISRFSVKGVCVWAGNFPNAAKFAISGRAEATGFTDHDEVWQERTHRTCVRCSSSQPTEAPKFITSHATLLRPFKVYVRSLSIGWNDVTYLWSQYDRHFVGQHRRTVRS